MARQDFAKYEYGLGRIDAGAKMMSRCIDLLLKRNNMTHEDLARLSRWSNPWAEQWLSTSQISNLRTAKLTKPGPQVFLALGEVNLRLAQMAGDRSLDVLALKDFGEVPTRIKEMLPSLPWFLRYQATGLPLNITGFSSVFLGETIPAGLGEDEITEIDAASLSNALSAMFDAWKTKQNLRHGAGLAQALIAYGVDDPSRLQLMREVLEGENIFDPEDIPRELVSIEGMVAMFTESDTALSPSDIKDKLEKFNG